MLGVRKDHIYLGQYWYSRSVGACSILLALLPITERSQAQPGTVASPRTIEQQIQAALEQGAASQADASLAQLLEYPKLDSNQLMRVGITFAQHGLYPQPSVSSRVQRGIIPRASGRTITWPWLC